MAEGKPETGTEGEAEDSPKANGLHSNQLTRDEKTIRREVRGARLQGTGDGELKLAVGSFQLAGYET
jgi:hypothetical protein